MTTCDNAKREPRRIGLLASRLLAVVLVAFAWWPGACSAASTFARALPNLKPPELLSLARTLAGNGRCDQAASVLDHFLDRPDRDTGNDWEAAVIREACRPPAPGTTPTSVRLNAVQVFVFRSADLESLEAELDSFRQRGLDTIIVRAFHNRGDRPLFSGIPVAAPGVYFASTEAPVAADVLGPVTETAHRLGLKVMAWMNTRRGDWLIERHPEWLELAYDPVAGRSLPTRSLSIFREGVRESLGRVFTDLAATGIDGILFQDDLIMRFSEGFSEAATRRFLLERGRGVHPDDLFVSSPSAQRQVTFLPLFWEWCGWKSDELLSFLRELVARARGVNPGLMVATNVYYESILADDKGLAWYAQDIRGLLASGVDFLAMMSYHRQIKSELSLNDTELDHVLERMVERSRSLAIDESRIIFKIQTTDWKTNQSIPEPEWERVESLFREAGNFSTALLQH